MSGIARCAAHDLIAGSMLLICVCAAPARAGQAIVYTWDNGEKNGWNPDSDKLKFEITDERTYDGQGKSLKLAGQEASYIGTSLYKPVTDKDTRVLVVYYAEGIAGDLTVQARSNQAGANLHALITPTVQDRWTIGEVKLANFTDWGGKAKGQGHTFSFLQIYSQPRKGAKATAIYLSRVVVYEGEDRTPPKAAEGVKAETKDLGVELSWSRVEDDVCTAQYEIYRGMKPDFEPTKDNLVGRSALTRFRDDSLANFGTYYYRICAVDAAGNRGQPSAAAKVNVRD